MDDDETVEDAATGVGWKARGDHRPEEDRRPFNRPRVGQVVEALPFVRRYFFYWLRHSKDKERLFINTFEPLQHRPHYGVPCGGIGAGAIGTDFRGGFCKFSLRPGLVEQSVGCVKANQFILCLRKGGKIVHQQVLSAVDHLGFAQPKKARKQLKSWKFDFPSIDVRYRGLYPRAWTRFDIPDHKVSVLIEQLSPILPGDYDDSSLPLVLFQARLDNLGDEEIDASITLTWRNGTGGARWSRESTTEATSWREQIDGESTASGTPHTAGVSLKQTIAGMSCVYAVSARDDESTAVSTCTHFEPHKDGAPIWKRLSEHGDLNDGPLVDSHNQPVDEVRERGVAVCCRSRSPIAPGTTNHPIGLFSLVWHMPVVNFGGRQRQYRRRYTKRWGCGDAAAALIAQHAIRNFSRWRSIIRSWQGPVINDPSLPEFYRSALFNELYFVTDGGTVWFDYDPQWEMDESHLSSRTKQLMQRWGRFGYLESWEYRMFNTYDVHFYASFALLQLWPQLEYLMQAEFTDAATAEDSHLVRFHMLGERAMRKQSGRMPHDLGNPAGDPWLTLNAYVMHNTGGWKDLNMKWILSAWRDLQSVDSLDEKSAQLDHFYPVAKNMIVDALNAWANKEGMIEHSGDADQTYDAWKMDGVSAYCGSLWLAALRVMNAAALLKEDKEMATLTEETFKKARHVFITHLWAITPAGKGFFRFCDRGRSRDTCMADQLCGFWYLQAADPVLAKGMLDDWQIESALRTIYELNVCGFADGRMGAVNGIRTTNGTVDKAYIQSDEMWVGVTYALAALLLRNGLRDQGFHCAQGAYESCYERLGLQYQTPEAIYRRHFYRAIGYMRPLAIWSMQWALRRTQPDTIAMADQDSGMATVDEQDDDDDDDGDDATAKPRDSSVHIL